MEERKDEETAWNTMDKISKESGEKIKKYIDEKIKKMETIQKQFTGSELLNSEAILNGEVKAWGTSAHIPFLKRFAGRKVKIIVLKKEEDKLKES